MLEQLLLKRPEITSVGENVEKRDPLRPVDENVNRYSRYGEESWGMGVGQMREGGQKVRTSRYKINKSRGCNV